jgi:hypothetical protein
MRFPRKKRPFLFVEEMTKAVLEAESESAARRTVAAVPSPALPILTSLHGSLMARQDPLLQFSVLYGFWGANLVAFNGDALRELASQFLTLAEKQEANDVRHHHRPLFW